MPDHERRDADRPAEARDEDEKHQHGLADTNERDEQEPERQRERQHGRSLAVAEGGDHLVVLERGLAGHADRDVGEVALERRDHAPDSLDGALVAGEAPALALGFGQDEQETLVFGQEVTGAGIVRRLDREERPEGRLVRSRPLQARRDQRDQVLHEPKVGGALALGEAEVDEVRDECGRDLRGHAVGQLVERRAGRERLHEFLIVEDRLANVGEPFLRQVEQAPPLELLGVDPVRDPLQRDVVGPQLTDEAVRVDRRLRQGGGLDDDGDVIEIPELALVLGVALDVGLARRQQSARGGGEGEVLERVDDREDRQGDGDEDGRDRPRAGDSHQRAERAADQPGERHLLVAGDEPLETLPGGVVGPLLGR